MVESEKLIKRFPSHILRMIEKCEHRQKYRNNSTYFCKRLGSPNMCICFKQVTKWS